MIFNLSEYSDGFSTVTPALPKKCQKMGPPKQNIALFLYSSTVTVALFFLHLNFRRKAGIMHLVKNDNFFRDHYLFETKMEIFDIDWKWWPYFWRSLYFENKQLEKWPPFMATTAEYALFFVVCSLLAISLLVFTSFPFWQLLVSEIFLLSFLLNTP